MITKENRAARFKTELKALLKKWNAEIELEDVSRGYAIDEEMVVYLDGVYKEGECVAEFTEIRLGKYVAPD